MILHVATAHGNATSEMMRVLNQIEDKHACPLERVGLTVDQVRSMTRAMHQREVARLRWRKEGQPLDDYVLGMVTRHKAIFVSELAQLCGESTQAIAGSCERLRRNGFPVRNSRVRVASPTGTGGVTRVILTWEGKD